MNWKNKLRVGTGIIILSFIGLFIMYLMVCKMLQADISFFNYLKAFGFLCTLGLIIYIFVTFIKWCFKPLDNK